MMSSVDLTHHGLSRVKDWVSGDCGTTTLSYDVAVIQWITSSHKNRMTIRVITFWRVSVASLTTSVSIMRFLIKILFILNAIKSHFKGSYDKQILTLVVILYEISETCRRLMSYISYEMTIRVRPSMYVTDNTVISQVRPNSI